MLTVLITKNGFDDGYIILNTLPKVKDGLCTEPQTILKLNLEHVHAGILPSRTECCVVWGSQLAGL